MPDISQINNLVKDINFPITKELLAQKASEQGLPTLVSKIQNLSDDVFNNPAEIMNSLTTNTDAENGWDKFKDILENT